MPDENPAPDHELRIRQVNHNSSHSAHDSLINSEAHENYDVILIQEPAINTLKKFSASPKWRVVYPSSHLSLADKIRAITLVNANISTNAWHQVDVIDSNDIVAIQIEGPFGTASIINIYNDQHHSRTLVRADIALAEIQDSITALPQPHDHYVVWAGDFNRHHPRWDEERNRQLFTARALEDAQLLIDILDEHHLDMALPKDIPTLEFMGRNKNWTRPDNVFCSQNAMEVLVRCTTVPGQRGAGTDHVPIDTTLSLPVTRIIPSTSHNFRATDWDEFKDTLKQKLAALPPPERIQSEAAFHQRVTTFTTSILDTIDQAVPKSKPSPHTKRWWNKDIETLRKTKNRLNTVAYRFRMDRQHPSHANYETRATSLLTPYETPSKATGRTSWRKQMTDHSGRLPATSTAPPQAKEGQRRECQS
jgi:hypothetical protein